MSGTNTTNTIVNQTSTAATVRAGKIDKFQFPQPQVEVGDSVTVTVNGTPVSYTVNAATYQSYSSVSDVVSQLAGKINRALGSTVTASSAGNILSIPANPANTTVSSSATATNSAAAVNTMSSLPSVTSVAGVRQSRTVTLTGTPGDISTALVGTGNAVSTAAHSAGSPATIGFTVDYGFGPQQITLNLGTYQMLGGLTQYAGKEINVTQLVQNGAPRGQFKDVVLGGHGTVMANCDNCRV